MNWLILSVEIKQGDYRYFYLKPNINLKNR